MKFTTLIVAGLTGLVTAQNLTGTPDCANPCLMDAVAKVCNPASDTACACAKTSDIGLAAVDCLLKSCNATELGQAQTAGAQVCLDFSATAAPVPSATTTGFTNATTTPAASVAPTTTPAANATTTASQSSTASHSSTSSTSRTTASATGTASATATPSSAAAVHGIGAAGVVGAVFAAFMAAL